MDEEHEVNIILYDSLRGDHGERLKKLILTLVPKKMAEIFHDIDELTHKLRQPSYNFTIAVLLAGNSEDLLELCMIRDLLFNIRVILILPEHDKKTVERGHLLRPSLISYIDSYQTEVRAVLDKLLGNTQRK